MPAARQMQTQISQVRIWRLPARQSPWEGQLRKSKHFLSFHHSTSIWNKQHVVQFNHSFIRCRFQYKGNRYWHVFTLLIAYSSTLLRIFNQVAWMELWINFFLKFKLDYFGVQNSLNGFNLIFLIAMQVQVMIDNFWMNHLRWSSFTTSNYLIEYVYYGYVSLILPMIINESTSYFIFFLLKHSGLLLLFVIFQVWIH